MFPAHFFMLFPVLQFMQRKRVMVIKIDIKALSSYECIITTSVANWLFEIHETVLPEYFGIQSLISFKARAQFWLTDSFPLNTAPRKICDGRFLRLASQKSQIASSRCVIEENHDREFSQIALIPDRSIADRKIADHNIYHSVFVCYLHNVAICDVAYRPSEIS